MLTLEDLERQIAELRTQNASQARRIADLEESIDVHVGIDYGAAQQLSPHPSQAISVAEYGGGAMRLDSNGIQVKSPSALTSAIYYVENLTDTPTSDLNRSQLAAWAYPGSPELRLTTFDGSSSRRAYLRQLGDTNTIQSEVNVSDGTRTAYVQAFVYTPDADVFVELSPAAKLVAQTADLASLYDGMLWYRSDTDRYRARANGITRNLTMDGTNTTLTIASGAVTATTAFHAIDTEAAAASDDLDTISGGQTGQVLHIHPANSARTIVAKDGTGNLKLEGDHTMDNAEDTLTIIYDGSNWLELSRSSNGA